MDQVPLLFKGIRLFDGFDVIVGSDVLVERGWITAVGSGMAGPEGAEIVCGDGRTLLPGLIDAHVHAVDGSLEQAVAFGVTTELDMFADADVAARLRKQAASRVDVADLLSAGTGATAPGGHPCQMVGVRFKPFPTIATAQEADDYVAARAAEGSDYFKIFASGVPGEPDAPELGGAVIEALVRSAAERALLTVAHATRLDSALTAVRCGVDGLTHLPFDAQLGAGFVAELAAAGTFVIPTLTMIESFCRRSAGVELARDPRIARKLPADVLDDLRSVMTSPPAPHYAPEHASRALRPLLDAGIPVLAGTDALAPGTAHGASLHGELELLVAAGLTQVEALTAATSAPAGCFGLTDRGAVRPGLRADLLLVSGDPTKEITDTRNILAVYRSGTPVTTLFPR